MKDKIEQSRRAGYSDQEIFEFLSKNPDYSDKIQRSVESGYKPQEILSFLEKNQSGQKSTPKEKEEGFLKSTARTLSQPLQGALEFTVGGLGASLAQLGGTGEALAELDELEERIPELQKLFPSAPWENFQGLDREKYLEGTQAASELFPTIENISSFIEKKTGLPLSPKTDLQKLIRFGGNVSNLTKGTAKQIAAKSLQGMATKSALESAGFPEPVSDLLALGITLHERTPEIKVHPAEKKGVEKAMEIPEGASGIPPGGGGGGSSGWGGIKDLFSTKKQAAQLAEEAIQQPRTSSFELAEDALKELSPHIEGKPLNVKVAPQELSGKPIEIKVSNHEIGHSISPVEFESKAAGGRAFNQNILGEASKERQTVSAAYKKAEKNYAGVSDVYPELSKEFGHLRDRIRQSALPNNAQKEIIKVLDHYLNLIGDSSGYIQVPVSRLIAGSDSLTSTLNYDIAFAGQKEVLKTIASSLDRAALQAIERAGKNPELFRSANKKYGEWANKFTNDEVSPYLAKNVLGPEKLFEKAAKDPASFRAVEQALSKDKQGKKLSNILARQVAENHMAQYVKNLEKVGTKQYQKDLNDLRELVGGHRANAFHRELLNAQNKREIGERTARIARNRLEGQKKRIESDTIKNKAKAHKTHNERTPEKLLQKFDSISGIKELRKKLSPETFEKLAKNKARSILQEGEVTKEFTGNNLYKTINRENNYENLSELLGKDAVEVLLKESKSISDKEINLGIINNILKSMLKIGVGAKAVNIVSHALKATIPV